MPRLIHESDLKLYARFMDLPGEMIHCPVARAEAFYAWARSKGYNTHQHLIKDPVKKVVKQKKALYSSLNNYMGGGEHV